MEGAPGTIEKGRRAMDTWLDAQSLDFPELLVDNGSGLSRDARISAKSIGRLLLHAYESPQMPEFMGSLAVTGVDGTMHTRFRGDPLAKRAHIKTGSLDDVSTMAGYVLDRDGRRWVVVLMINQPGLTSWRGRQIQDVVLGWVFDRTVGRQQRMAGADGKVPRPADGNLAADAVRSRSVESDAQGARGSGSDS